MASVDRPVILLLSLQFRSFFDESYSSLIDDLHKSAELKRVKSASGAINYLNANSPSYILVTDEGLTMEQNKAVLDRVMSYIRNGGLVIIGLHFPNFTDYDAFDKFFEGFGFAWKCGDYHRTDFQLNPSYTLPAGVASNSLPAPYSMKVLHVKNAQSHEKIFVPVPNAMTQSLVFPPGFVDQTQAGVVGAKVGNGHLIYIGDVNGEKESNEIIRALCGL